MADRPRAYDLPGTIAGAAFACLALVLIIESRSMTAMGSVFPTTISAAMLALSAALIARNLLPAFAKKPDSPPAAASMQRESRARRIAFMIAMAAWVGLIPFLGFYLSSLAAFAAILAIASHERSGPKTWALLGGIGLAIVTGFSLLMSKVLLIPLP